MLVYAVALIWMLGVFSLGFLLLVSGWKLSFTRAVALAYPVGLAVVGLVGYGLWLSNVAFGYITTATWAVLLSSLAVVGWRGRFQLLKRLPKLSLHGWWQLNPFQSLLFWLGSGTLLVILAWLWLVQPVVWDSLVLYDWRAARIAEGWQLVDFFQQFTRHSEFYNYDFSHPFLSSIWQAFLHKSGVEAVGLIYSGLLVSLLYYAGIIWKKRGPWLVFVALLFLTEPMVTVMTQVYGSLPYFLYWLFIFMIFIDREIPCVVQKSALVLLSMSALLLNRLSEPFWMVFWVWWLWQTWQEKRTWQRWLLASLLTVLPTFVLFAAWQSLQQEALTYVQVAREVTRSSYDPGRYASLVALFEHPQWWGEAVWLATVKNPSGPYLLLTALVAGVSQVWKKDREKQLVLIGLTWFLMLAGGLVLEISTDPTHWMDKSRLLWRVTLPLMAWSIVTTTHLVKRHWSK